MSPDESLRKGVKLWCGARAGFAPFTKEVSNVLENADQVIEFPERTFLHEEGTIAIGLVATFDLYANLLPCPLGVRMDTDDVVALLVRRRFVGKDVAAHQVAHYQILGSQCDDRQSQGLLLVLFHLAAFTANRAERRCFQQICAGPPPLPAG